MPGLAILVSSQPAQACGQQVDQMRSSMDPSASAPSGWHGFPELGVYVAWVARPDASGGFGLSWNLDRTVAIALSGECFTHAAPASRPAGEQNAHAGCGDRVLHLYDQFGDRCLDMLDGLFSGVLVDLRSRSALVFNDRYGMERLYWHEAEGALYLASEAKAILCVVPGARDFDAAGVAQFLGFGCTLGTRTLFRGIELAPGGALWRITQGQCRQGRYFSPEAWESQPSMSPGEFEEAFRDVFRRVAPAYTEPVERVALSLTGGLDTRMILAALPQNRLPAASYTFAGASPRLLDARIASDVARLYGIPHIVLRIGTDFLQQFGDYADRTVWSTDGALGVLGAHEIYLNAMARELAPVRLTGNFGSEVLRNMSTFKFSPPAPEILSGDGAARVAACRLEHRPCRHPVRRAAFEEIPWNLFGTFCAGRSQVAFRTPYLDQEVVRLAFRAPEPLRTSPHPALRFIRESRPALAAIPTDRGVGGNGPGTVRRLRRWHAVATFKLDYYCTEGLPWGLSRWDPVYQKCCSVAGIQGTHKFLTHRNWLRKELSGFAADRLSVAAKAGLPFLEPVPVKRLAREHASGEKNRTREIHAVLTLEAVQRLLLRPSASGALDLP